MHKKIRETQSFRSALILGGVSAAALLHPLTAVAQAAGVTANTLPSGGSVARGTASIGLPGVALDGRQSLDISQSSQAAVINWDSFSVGSNARVNIQQTPGGVLLNRVQGNQVSEVWGQLNATGSVFLINPSGVLFGAGSQVNVGALVASTLNISDDHFMAGAQSGQFVFDAANASGAQVINRGSLSAADAGTVALLGQSVRNEGTIAARLGTVALGAGGGVTLQFQGNRLLTVTLQQADYDTLVSNNSLIKADGGWVLMSAQTAAGLARSVVSNGGVIEALGLPDIDPGFGSAGRIELLADFNRGQVLVGGSLSVDPLDSALVGSGSVQTSGAEVRVATDAQVVLGRGESLGQWRIEHAGDFLIAPTKGHLTGQVLSQALNTGHVSIDNRLPDTPGASGQAGDVIVKDDVIWGTVPATGQAPGVSEARFTGLSLSALGDIHLYGSLKHTQAEAPSDLSQPLLKLAYGLGQLPEGNTADYHLHAGSQVVLPKGLGVLQTQQGREGDTRTFVVLRDAEGYEATRSSQVSDEVINVALGGDLDLSSLEDLQPWSVFKGVFEGFGYEISGYHIQNKSGGSGLIYQNDGILRNFTVQGRPAPGGWIPNTVSSSQRQTSTGGLVAVNSDRGVIQNVHLNNVEVSSIGGDGVGGLVGYNKGRIEDSSFDGAVTVTSTTIEPSPTTSWVVEARDVGGLVGHNEWTGKLVNVSANARVFASESASVSVGGLVGINKGSIHRASSSSEVTGLELVGGLVGYNLGDVRDTLSTGAVYGELMVGGLVGYHSDSGRLSSSISTSPVQGTSEVGWVVGAADNHMTVERVFWLTGQHGDSDVAIPAAIFYDLPPGQSLSAAFGKPLTLVALSQGLPEGLSPTEWGQLNLPGKLTSTPFLLHTPQASAVWVSEAPGGEASQAYAVANAQQLQSMAHDLQGRYLLARDIDMDSVRNFRPVGTLRVDVPNASATFTGFDAYNVAEAFTGTLDGLNHTIRNLNIESSWQGVGLFGATAGVVKDLQLEGGAIKGVQVQSTVGDNTYTAGGAYVGAVAGNNFGVISNVHSSAAVSGNRLVGGLVGYHSGSALGFGLGDGLTAMVEGSSSSGVVQGQGARSSDIGGLVGSLWRGASIERSHFSGSVQAPGATHVGGLLGSRGLGAGDIRDAYVTGSVQGGSAVGGIAGSWILGELKNVFVTGAVRGGGQVGGLVGSVGNGANQVSINHAYWATDTTGQATSAGGGTALTLAGLQSALPEGFDPVVWGNGRNQATPYLLSNAGITYLKGDATNTPYQVVLTPQQLQAIGQQLDGHFALGRDIDMANAGPLTPIGSYANPFTGELDGLGFAVQHLSVVPQFDATGLLGANAGTLRNIGVAGGLVRGSTVVGGLVGLNDNKGLVENVFSGADVQADNAYVGGVVGYNRGTVRNAHATGSVQGGLYVGGLVGLNGNTVENSYSTASVTGGSDLGGLVGGDFGRVSQSHWDVGTSGIAAAPGQAGTGVTRATLMSALPEGWDPAVWGLLPGKSLPYLLQQFNPGETPVPIWGQLANSAGQAVAAGQEVSGWLDGQRLSSVLTGGTVKTGADGSYYYLLAPGSGGGDVPLGPQPIAPPDLNRNSGWGLPWLDLAWGGALLLQARVTNDATPDAATLVTDLVANWGRDAGVNLQAGRLGIVTTREGLSSAHAQLSTALGREVAPGDLMTFDPQAQFTQLLLHTRGDFNLNDLSTPLVVPDTVLLRVGGSLDQTDPVKTVAITGEVAGNLNLVSPGNLIGKLSKLSAGGTFYATSNIATSLQGQLQAGDALSILTNASRATLTLTPGTQIKARTIDLVSGVQPQPPAGNSGGVGGAGSASGPGGTGGLVAGTPNALEPVLAIDNQAGADALQATEGWRLWAQRSDLVTLGGLGADFKQYNATFGSTRVQGTGHGLMFGLAPTLSLSLPSIVEKVYDGGVLVRLDSSQLAVSGAIDGDVVQVQAEGLMDSRHVGENIGVTVGRYQVDAVDAQQRPVYGYQVDTASTLTTGRITPANLVLSAVADGKTYDGNTSSNGVVGALGLQGADTYSATQAFGSRDAMGRGLSTLLVNSYAINDGNDGRNYTVSLNTAAGTISPALLVLTANADSKVYDGTQRSLGQVRSSGLVQGDTVSSLRQQYHSQHVLGTQGSTLEVAEDYFVNDGNGGRNYTVVRQTAQGSITPADLKLQAVFGVKTYDGTTRSDELVQVEGLKEDDQVLATQTYDSKNVGLASSRRLSVSSYTVNDGNEGRNYNVTTADAQGVIEAASLTLTPGSFTRVYDGSLNVISTVQATGLAKGDAYRAEALLDSPHVKGTDGSVVTVRGYTITDGNGGQNYVVRTAKNTATITPAPLRISAASDQKVYDGTTASDAKVGVTGLRGNDEVFKLSQAFESRHVLGEGQSTLQVTGYQVIDGNGGRNYEVSTESAAGTIAPASLTLTAWRSYKVYDGTTAVSKNATVAVDGLMAIDQVSAQQAYTSKHAIGDGRSVVKVTGHSVEDGNDGKNYVVTTKEAAGTIAPKDAYLQAVSDTKVYDGTTMSTGVVKGVGFVEGDTFEATQVFKSANVQGSNGSELVVGQVKLPFSNDYRIIQVSAKGSITPAELVLQASTDTKVYDATVASKAPVQAIGLKGQDTVQASQQFASQHVLGQGGSTLQVGGEHSLSDGNGGRNYTVVKREAMGTITPAELVLQASSDTRTYDSTTASNAPVQVSGLKGQDTAQASQQFASQHVLGTDGSTLQVQAGHRVNDGNEGRNYTVTKREAAGTILPAPLILSATGDTKAFDGNTSSKGEVKAFGLQGQDALTAATQAFESRNVLGLNGSTLGVSSFVINDGNQGRNYAPLLEAAQGTITPVPLSVVANSATMLQGQAVPALSATVQGLVGGDTLADLQGTLTLSTTATRTSPQGRYPVIPRGLEASNYEVSFVNGEVVVNAVQVPPNAQNPLIPNGQDAGVTAPTEVANTALLAEGDANQAPAAGAASDSNAGLTPERAKAQGLRGRLSKLFTVLGSGVKE